MKISVKGQYCATYSNTSHAITIHSTQALPSVSLTISPIMSLFSLPSPGTQTTMIFGITKSFSIIILEVSLPTVSSANSLPATVPLSPHISLHSESTLPLDCPIRALVPVDPMAWSSPQRVEATYSVHDVLLSVTDKGELAFWIPDTSTKIPTWKCTGKVRTGRTNILMAACSSYKKTVLGK